MRNQMVLFLKEAIKKKKKKKEKRKRKKREPNKRNNYSQVSSLKSQPCEIGEV